MGMFRSSLLRSEIKGYSISENISFSDFTSVGNASSNAQEGPFNVVERTALTENGPNVYGTADLSDTEESRSSAIAGELFRGVFSNPSDEPMSAQVTVNLIYKLETSVSNPMLETAEAGVGFRLIVRTDGGEIDLLKELATAESGIRVLVEETKLPPTFFTATDVLKNSGTDCKEVTINREFTFLIPPKTDMKFEFASTSFGRTTARVADTADKPLAMAKA